MGSLGMQEIIVIFVLALIIFGPRKLPDLGKSLGRGMAEFKKASNELKQTWEDEVRLDKEKQDMAEILKDSPIGSALWRKRCGPTPRAVATLLSILSIRKRFLLSIRKRFNEGCRNPGAVRT